MYALLAPVPMGHPKVTPAHRSGLSSAPRDTRPVWLAWKQAIDRLAPSSLSRAFASLRGMLDGGQMFDVVGVVERFEDTCRLLDALLPLPRGEPGRPAYRTYLAAATALRVSHHSEDWKRAEEAARTAAIEDRLRAGLGSAHQFALRICKHKIQTCAHMCHCQSPGVV